MLVEEYKYEYSSPVSLAVQSVEVASFQSRLDESQSKVEGLQTQIISLQVWECGYGNVGMVWECSFSTVLGCIPPVCVGSRFVDPQGQLKDQELRNERLSVKLQQRPEADDLKAMQQELSSLHLILEQSASEHEKQLKALSADKLKAEQEKTRFCQTGWLSQSSYQIGRLLL